MLAWVLLSLAGPLLSGLAADYLSGGSTNVVIITMLVAAGILLVLAWRSSRQWSPPRD
jgi:sugar phosphate permease